MVVVPFVSRLKTKPFRKLPRVVYGCLPIVDPDSLVLADLGHFGAAVRPCLVVAGVAFSRALPCVVTNIHVYAVSWGEGESVAGQYVGAAGETMFAGPAQVCAPLRGKVGEMRCPRV